MTNGTVLVTRPKGTEASLVDALEAAGYRAVCFPVMAIEALPEQDPAAKARILDLDHYRHVIAISSNAAALAVAWIDRFWPQLPIGVLWYAIGASTAARMREYGIDCVAAAGAMNSEALLEEPGLQSLAGEKVLIFRGVGGREYLAQRLRDRGASVDYCELYRRVVPECGQGELERVINAHQVDILSATSVESLDNLLALSNSQAELRNKTLLVPGQRVADAARAAGFSTILTAKNATPAALLEALEDKKKDVR